MQRTEPAGEPKRVAIVGPGRLGTAIAAALREDDQLVVTGPLGRGADAVARSLARSLGMRTVRVAPDDRVVYHAAAAALTGPVARGDELTVAAQRAAVAERAPELLELFDALTETTRTLATSTLATSTLATSTLATSAAGRA
jgi:predicted short-subunit dehydrogenase-like oxidoreductase (DUF2520 family)